MKKLIYILLLFCLNASATNYYIKNGGSDVATGTTDGTAWETISKVNGETFAAGDSILFNRGDTFVGNLIVSNSGTSSDYIVYGSYGTGLKPKLTPNDLVSGLTWVLHGDDIWKTTDIDFDPENVITSNNNKLFKVNNEWVGTNPTDGSYWDFDALELMATDADIIYDVGGLFEFYFWDGIESLFCYDDSGVTDTTYIRFRNGENPNDSVFHVAAANSKAISITTLQYIVIENLYISGGEYGVYIQDIPWGNTNNVIVQNCKIENSHKKVYIYTGSGGTRGITVRNDSMTNDYLGQYTPYPWSGYTGGYPSYIGYHFYRWFKTRWGESQSTDIDQAVSDNGTSYTIDSCIISGNVIINCTNGIGTPGQNCQVYNNYIENTSSVGIHNGRYADNALIHDNYIKNSNLPFRFQYMDQNERTAYYYRNRIENTIAGEAMYLHYQAEGPSLTTVYFYHNSFIGIRGVVSSGYADNDAAATGFHFINNIFSFSELNSGIYGGVVLANKANMWVWYNNWTGGTYYGAALLPNEVSVWAVDESNMNRAGETFWDHAIDPPDFTNIIGTEVIGTGIDITAPFTIGGVEYSALPGTFNYYGTPDIGYYEYRPVTISPFSQGISGGKRAVVKGKRGIVR